MNEFDDGEEHHKRKNRRRKNGRSKKRNKENRNSKPGNKFIFQNIVLKSFWFSSYDYIIIDNFYYLSFFSDYESDQYHGVRDSISSSPNSHLSHLSILHITFYQLLSYIIILRMLYKWREKLLCLIFCWNISKIESNCSKLENL